MTPEQLDLLTANDHAAILSAPAPGRVRRDGPDTSVRAARAVAPRTGTHRARILCDLLNASQGRTAEEAWKRTGGRFPHVASTRLSELARDGLVVMTERVRPTDAGHDAHVWTLTPEGRDVARVLAEVAA